jgi:hypothetical protein
MKRRIERTAPRLVIALMLASATGFLHTPTTHAQPQPSSVPPSAPASAPVSSPPTAPLDGVDDDAPEWMKKLGIDPSSDAARKYTEQAKKRKGVEKELRKIRGTYFLTRNTKKRQEGIAKLWEYKDPAYFPSLSRTFEREGTDVRTALLDLFADSKSEAGDATLTWMAVFDSDANIRAEAVKRVRARITEEGKAPLATKHVIFEGLASHNQTAMSAAAGVAKELQLVEAIPWLINTQIQGVQTGNSSGGSTGALAWIAIGTQTTYVSGLRPVVSEGAVAFDPQISVDNSGVVVRINDAVTYQYNFDIYNSLVDISTNAWDQPTRSLGFNVPKWNRWYTEQFTPYWTKKQAALAEAKRKAQEEATQTDTDAPVSTPAEKIPKPGGG